MLGESSTLTLNFKQPDWVKVCDIPAGSNLATDKAAIWNAINGPVSRISSRFGCYSWASANTMLYVGSFTQDYKQHHPNLKGRIYQYFNNHKRDPNGKPINTNAIVLGLIGQQLATSAITLNLFNFEDFSCLDEHIPFRAYESDGVLVKAVEHTLIWIYKHRGQCAWNSRAKEY